MQKTVEKITKIFPQKKTNSTEMFNNAHESYRLFTNRSELIITKKYFVPHIIKNNLVI